MTRAFPPGGLRISWRPDLSLQSPSFGNVELSYLLFLPIITAPISYFFARKNQLCDGRRLKWHYHYIRITALGLICGLGAGLAGIVIGAQISNSVALSGIALCLLTMSWTFARSLYGLTRAHQHKPLRDHKTFLL